MSHPQLHSTCDDCDSLLQHAAIILSSSSQRELSTEYDDRYQSRLLANVNYQSCHMCVLLHADIPHLAAPLSAGKRLIFGASRTQHDSLAVSIGLKEIDDADPGFQKYFTGSLRVQGAGHGTIRILRSSQTWSLETLNRLRSWLQDCLSSHRKCASPKGSGRLPSRLVDVGPIAAVTSYPTGEINQSNFDQLSIDNSHGICVVSAQALPLDTEYLTLSHRWGSPPSMLLTEKTYSLLTGDFSVYLLSCEEAAVFRHAIHVTRALGFRYVWIDALCIVQDDELERTAEILQMDNIYSNSTLNISATEGDVYQGLVFDRATLRTNPCIATANTLSTEENMLLLVFREKRLLRPWEGPLNRRGWVFQERTLAPRIVHFTKEQVFWECWSLEASETLPAGLPNLQVEGFDKAIGIKPGTYEVAQMKSRWYHLVMMYSRTSLTFAHDYLLEISAVAKRFCSAMDIPLSQYLAGMWADDLPLSLIWTQESMSMSGSEADETDLERRHAPSWSWASIMTPIATPDLSILSSTTKVISINTKRSSPNPFDSTDFCCLRIRGPVCRVRRFIHQDTHWIQVTRHVVFEEFVDSYFHSGKSIVMCWDTARKFRSDEFLLLHVVTGKDVERPTERGLILLRTPERGTYKRVGVFIIPFESHYPGSKLHDAFEGRLQTLSPQHYIEVDSEGQYTIDII